MLVAADPRVLSSFNHEGLNSLAFPQKEQGGGWEVGSLETFDLRIPQLSNS